MRSRICKTVCPIWLQYTAAVSPSVFGPIQLHNWVSFFAGHREKLAVLPETNLLNSRGDRKKTGKGNGSHNQPTATFIHHQLPSSHFAWPSRLRTSSRELEMTTGAAANNLDEEHL